MVSAFGVIIPMGIFVSRYGKFWGGWFQTHRAVQVRPSPGSNAHCCPLSGGSKCRAEQGKYARHCRCAHFLVIVCRRHTESVSDSLHSFTPSNTQTIGWLVATAGFVLALTMHKISDWWTKHVRPLATTFPPFSRHQSVQRCRLIVIRAVQRTPHRSVHA